MPSVGAGAKVAPPCTSGTLAGRAKGLEGWALPASPPPIMPGITGGTAVEAKPKGPGLFPWGWVAGDCWGIAATGAAYIDGLCGAGVKADDGAPYPIGMPGAAVGAYPFPIGAGVGCIIAPPP
jgi:hypothetical protein